MKSSAIRVACFAAIALGARVAAADAQVTVLDALNGRDPAASLTVFGTSGISVLPAQHSGPEFVLAAPTVITEIGAFANNCGEISAGVPNCPNASPLMVEIRPANDGRPDPNIVIASFSLTDDLDPLVMSYESVHLNLLLPAGTYFALFAPATPADAGVILGTTNDYHAGLVPGGTVDPGSSATFTPGLFLAVRILGALAPVPTVAAIADTYVRAGVWATTNFGRAPVLTTKKGASPDNTRRSYLKFEIGAVPDVQRATLRLYGRLSVEGGSTTETIVYGVRDTSWDERALTWNSKPDLGNILARFVVASTTPRWFEVDVTAFVREEQRAGHTVVALALRNVTHSSAFARFASRESGSAAPQLVIAP
jgi:hypothetical protein